MRNALVTICSADVIAREVAWLWYPYIPIGELTVAEGDPGIGKGWFAYALTAWVSRGTYPVGTGKQGKVLIASAEDDADTVIRPRLDLLGADLSQVHILQQWRPILSDIPALGRRMRELACILIVIDPITSFLPAYVDQNHAEQIKPVLDRLVSQARTDTFAAYVVRHYAKRETANPLHKGAGSIGIVGTARSMLAFGPDPEFIEPEDLFHRQFIVAQGKENLAPRGPSLRFSLKKDAFAFLGTTKISAADLLQQGRNINMIPENYPGELRDKLLEALEYLTERLGGGPVRHDILLGEGKDLGLSTATLHRAAHRLKITRHRIRADTNGRIRCVTWELPGCPAPTAPPSTLGVAYQAWTEQLFRKPAS